MINPAINPIPFRVWNLIAINLQFLIASGLLYEYFNKVISFNDCGELIRKRIQSIGINPLIIMKSWQT